MSSFETFIRPVPLGDRLVVLAIDFPGCLGCVGSKFGVINAYVQGLDTQYTSLTFPQATAMAIIAP